MACGVGTQRVEGQYGVCMNLCHIPGGEGGHKQFMVNTELVWKG